MKRSQKVGLTLGLGFAIFILLFWFLSEGTVEPLPDPNGYLTLTRAGRMLQSEAPNAKDASIEELQTYLSQSHEAFRLANSALTQQCRVPIGYSEVYMPGHTLDLMAIRRLGTGFEVAGKLAERENRLNDALTNYLIIVYIGHEAVRGGFMIDFLVGTACETGGTRALQRIVSLMDMEQCRQLVAALEELEGKREPFEQTAQRERKFVRKQIRDWKSIAEFFRDAIDAKSLVPWRDAINSGKDRLREVRSETDHLLVSLAARIYQLEKGRAPSSVNDLVPAYLNKIPVDPITGTNLVFGF